MRKSYLGVWEIWSAISFLFFLVFTAVVIFWEVFFEVPLSSAFPLILYGILFFSLLFVTAFAVALVKRKARK